MTQRENTASWIWYQSSYLITICCCCIAQGTAQYDQYYNKQNDEN